MGMRAFVDGYDRTVGIKEDAGLQPAVEWTYRPLAGTEASDAYMSFAKATDPRRAKLEFICGRISQWRFPDSEDAPAEFEKPSVENLERLNAVAYIQIETIIMGTGKPDYEIKETAAEPVVAEPAKSDAELSGDDAKNSPTGSLS
jgi:hypothetical protein